MHDTVEASGPYWSAKVPIPSDYVVHMLHQLLSLLTLTSVHILPVPTARQIHNFTDEKADTQRGYKTCPRSHGEYRAVTAAPSHI